MADLKPCPFCGSRAEGPHKEGGGDERNGYNFTMTVTCSGCGASNSEPSHEGSSGWCDDTGQAAGAVTEAWNRRTEERDQTR